jgi:hypothetical protein
MVSSGWQNRSMIAARRLCPTPSRRQRNADCINGTDKQVESFRKNVSARIGGLGKSDRRRRHFGVKTWTLSHAATGSLARIFFVTGSSDEIGLMTGLLLAEQGRSGRPSSPPAAKRE